MNNTVQGKATFVWLMFSIIYLSAAYSKLNAQILYGDFDVNNPSNLNLSNCNYDTIGTLGASPALAIDIDGLFTRVNPASPGEYYLEIYDNSLDGDYAKSFGPFFDTPGTSHIGACSAEDGLFFVCSNSSVYRLDTKQEIYEKLGVFDGYILGDIEYNEGSIYSSSLDLVSPIPTGQINKSNAVTGEFQSIFIRNASREFTAAGIAESWSDDCSSKVLIAPSVKTDESNDVINSWYSKIPYNYDNTVVIEKLCLSTNPISNGAGFDAASWETHRQTCEVRLDLDDNDSQGRAGPHFRDAPICTEQFPLTDADVSIWTMDDSPVDSLRVSIKDRPATASEDALTYLDMPGLIVVNAGDTLLRVFPDGPSPAYAVWTEWLREIRLTTGDQPVTGRRTVETHLYAMGLEADGARSFINVRPELPFAGRDTTLFVCRSRITDVPDVLPGATEGGRWEPELLRLGDRLVFHSDSLPLGQYRYITDMPGCRPDTAVVDVRIDPVVLAAHPAKYDTVYLCPGTSYEWNPVTTNRVLFLYFQGRFNDEDPPFTLTEPGTYLSRISYVSETSSTFGCTENIYLTVLPAAAEQLTVLLDTTACAGDAVLFGGREFLTAGSYEFTSPGNGCDTTFQLQLAYAATETVRVDTALCSGESLLLGGQTFTASGSYAFTGPRTDDGCPVVYDLTLDIATSTPIVDIDTAICFGDTLSLGDQLLYSTGPFKFVSLGPACDTLFQGFLEVFGGEGRIDTAIMTGEQFCVLDTCLTDAGTYQLSTTGIMGCDSLLTVVLDVISATTTTAGREQLRVVNPLTNLTAFRAVDSDGSRLSVHDLHFFDVAGRRLSTTDVRIPAGVYFYAFRLVKGEGPWYRGKVLVTN